MTVPRIVFSRFERADSPRLAPWREHRRRVLGSIGASFTPVLPPGGAVVWQLVSGNNRILARGAEVFADVPDAVCSATDAIEAAGAEGALALVNGDRQGHYGWYIHLAERPLALCSRWYPAERQRRQSGLLALASLSRAHLAVAARVHFEADRVVR